MTRLNNWFIEHIPSYKLAIENTDPRTRDWFLLWADPVPMLTLVLIYLIIVIFGPRYMKHRQAIHVPTWILFSYNMALVVLSIYMVEEIVVGIYGSGYNLFCQRMNVSWDKYEMKVTNALWFYFFSKAIEFMDTIFMVVRKRFTQITFLHVFHHSTMLIIWWIVVTWIPGGQAWLGPVLNSAIHVLMYSYYGLSVIPSLRDKLWWKKYITILQLLQFILIFSHTFSALVRGCDFPLWGQLLLNGYMIVMLILFSNFFYHEYITRSNDAKRRKQRIEHNKGKANGEILPRKNGITKKDE